MGIKNRISNAQSAQGRDFLYESFIKEERAYKADRLVEKWSRVKEVGKGIENMPTSTARNLAILLENQAAYMSKMTEAQLSNSFAGYSPENMLRLVRLSYPNSIRGMLFTEFAMQTANDSIKYIEPIYTDAQRSAFEPDADYTMLDRFDSADSDRDVMYESFESRYATELVNVFKEARPLTDVITIDFNAAPAMADCDYIPGGEAVYVHTADGKYCVAMRASESHMHGADSWMVGSIPTANGKIGVTVEDYAKGVLTLKFESVPADAKFTAVARFNSEKDLLGKHLGEVELQVRDYHFRPRPVSLGVTWTQLSELVLDSSFGVSAEEMLMDFAAQEIKKTLDFQAVKLADATQRMKASDNYVRFNAEAADASGTKDSYWHTAQLVGQAINRIGDLQLNKINRGGVSAIVGGPAAVEYLKLSQVWKDTGRQANVGGHKVGEYDGIPVFKVPANVIADDELVTTWKNSSNENDVAMAIGTLVPFFSTGAIQRKNFYKEAGIARYEDTRVLQPNYFGRIKIENLRNLNYIG